MENHHKPNNFLTLYLLFIFFSSNFTICISQDTPSLLDQQKIQFEKLDELIEKLTQLVSKLESQFQETPRGERSEIVNFNGEIGFDRSRKTPFPVTIPVPFPAPVLVTKYNPFWSERFQFLSAVKLDTGATCVNVLPYRDYEGISKYFAVGSDRGKVYVFLRNGDVMVEFDTLLKSPINAMISYMSVYKNESFLVTGHKNGVILVHRVWEASNGEESNSNSISMESLRKFNSNGNSEDLSEITLLEVHHVGRMRYILSVDGFGKIRVFREDGSVYGSAMPSSKPIAFLKQRLLFMTETGAGSLDLRSMKIRESECEGLNHSVARKYVFDVTERSKAYGFSSEGEIFHVFLLGDIVNFKCRVRYKKKVDFVEPIALQAIKGYLLIVSVDKVLVYNVSSQHYVRVGGPRLLFSTDIDDIRSGFLNRQVMDVDSDTISGRGVPLIGSDREKLVVIGLGGGYVGLYRSNLPIFKGDFNTMLWTSPVLFFILFLFVAWHFFAKKKEALTSWGPDDPFSSTSATTGAPSFAESSSRNSDMMELRSGGGLRGPTRRYVSPSRYPGGGAGSFRPGSAEPTARGSSVDPNYRTTSEMKFRGANMETTGFPKRRESLFANSQVVDDSG